MKSWNSAFNAQVILVVVQVGVVEIYVAAVEALRKKESEGHYRMKLSLRQKEMVHFWLSPPPFPPTARYPWKANYFFAGFFFERHPILDETQGSSAVFSWLYRKLSYILLLFVCLHFLCGPLQVIWAQVFRNTFLYTSKIWPNRWFKWTHATDHEHLLTRIKFYSDGSWPKGRTNKRMNEWMNGPNMIL